MYRLELVRKILSLCRVDILTHFYRICNVYSRKNKKSVEFLYKTPPTSVILLALCFIAFKMYSNAT